MIFRYTLRIVKLCTHSDQPIGDHCKIIWFPKPCTKIEVASKIIAFIQISYGNTIIIIIARFVDYLIMIIFTPLISGAFHMRTMDRKCDRSLFTAFSICIFRWQSQRGKTLNFKLLGGRQRETAPPSLRKSHGNQ